MPPLRGIDTSWATVRENLVPLLIHATVGGRWFAADPGVFYIRREKNALTDEENWLLTGSIALIGRLFLTPNLALAMVRAGTRPCRAVRNAGGPRAPVSQRILFAADGVPLAYRVSYAGGAPVHRIDLYIWGGQARDHARRTGRTRPAPGVALGPASDAGMMIERGALSVPAHPLHVIRIADFVTA